MNGSTSFDKGKIFNFHEIVKEKINQIINDIDLEYKEDLFIDRLENKKTLDIIIGSTLEKLPEIDTSFNLIVTSPPYCKDMIILEHMHLNWCFLVMTMRK